MFVDIVGFSDMSDRQSRMANAQTLSVFEQTLRPCVEFYKGCVVKGLGDAMLLSFRSASNALLCAMAVQDAFLQTREEQGADLDNQAEPLHVRIAAHMGEVRLSEGDVFGPVVNEASRLEGITPADSIYLSEALRLSANRNEIQARGVSFNECGLRQLKGVAEPLRVYQLIPLDEGSDFPFSGLHREVQAWQRAAGSAQGSSPGVLHRYQAYAALVALVVAALSYVLWPEGPEGEASVSAPRSVVEAPKLKPPVIEGQSSESAPLPSPARVTGERREPVVGQVYGEEGRAYEDAGVNAPESSAQPMQIIDDINKVLQGSGVQISSPYLPQETSAQRDKSSKSNKRDNGNKPKKKNKD